MRSKYRILLVDDDPDITFTFKKGIEEGCSDSIYGIQFSVDSSNDPLEALSSFRNSLSTQESQYDLLLLDLKMPKMNGFEFYQEANKITNYEFKACFITAFDNYYEILKRDFPSLNVGCFIKKPIAVNELRNRIKSELMESELIE